MKKTLTKEKSIRQSQALNARMPNKYIISNYKN